MLAVLSDLIEPQILGRHLDLARPITVYLSGLPCCPELSAVHECPVRALQAKCTVSVYILNVTCMQHELWQLSGCVCISHSAAVSSIVLQNAMTYMPVAQTAHA